MASAHFAITSACLSLPVKFKQVNNAPVWTGLSLSSKMWPIASAISSAETTGWVSAGQRRLSRPLIRILPSGPIGVRGGELGGEPAGELDSAIFADGVVTPVRSVCESAEVLVL